MSALSVPCRSARRAKEMAPAAEAIKAGAKSIRMRRSVSGSRHTIGSKPTGQENSLGDYIVPPCNWELWQTSSWLNFYLGRDHTAKRLGIKPPRPPQNEARTENPKEDKKPPKDPTPKKE